MSAPAADRGVSQSAHLPSISRERREEIRQCLIGPLSAMTGFALMSEPDRKEAGRFWIEALAEYDPQEIRDAFKAFTRTGNKYPNPQAIVALILDARRASRPIQSRATPLPPSIELTPEQIEARAEKANAVLRDMRSRLGGRVA